ncbi:hypothetical protein A8H35_14515 [Burkholderia thailandensis]|nr:hypothetical protein A8H35_14515 [Burkholderia thailandensis]AWY66394.1 hypothetical protein A8H36_13920 [Burkholderia thailandensis]
MRGRRCKALRAQALTQFSGCLSTSLSTRSVENPGLDSARGRRDSIVQRAAPARANRIGSSG